MSPSSWIETAAERSDLVRDALALTWELHSGEWRETGAGKIPFIDHPLAVAERLAEERLGEEVVAAGLLHDVIEYTHFPLPRLRDRFGVDVAAIVFALTEDMGIENYEERKDELRQLVAEAGPDAWMVFAADKVSNVEVLRRAYAIEGEEVDEDLPIELNRKILVWEDDLEMLFEETEPGKSRLVDRFASEMIELWGQRAKELRSGLI
ncbi:MAG TPA: HD domain-containing protein [Solirubrobacterales bacterium]